VQRHDLSAKPAARANNEKKKHMAMHAHSTQSHTKQAPCLWQIMNLYQRHSLQPKPASKAARQVCLSASTAKLQRLIVGKNIAALHVLQRQTAAAHNAAQGVFGNQHRQASFFGQQAVQVTQ
jgi:hypothetical protein